uniref:CTCK domain-containing protein n=1 Tax=Panagrellus redivivus TaxID=6233 RepID=A0A7E4V4S2_PANRE
MTDSNFPATEPPNIVPECEKVAGFEQKSAVSRHRSALRRVLNLAQQQRRLLFIVCCWVVMLSNTGHCGTLRPSCRLAGHEELIDVAGCDLVAVKVNKCHGYCSSISFLHPVDQGALAMKAECCRMLEVQKVSVNVSCKDGPRTIEIPSALECGCSFCAVDRI